MARVAWKMAPKYQKNAKWPKITFRGLIWVPEVAFWGFWGLVFPLVKNSTEIFETFQAISIHKRQQKNTQAKILEKIAS